MHATLAVCLFVALWSVADADEALQVTAEQGGDGAFRGRLTFGAKGSDVSVVCVPPVKLSASEQRDLIWTENDDNLCVTSACKWIDRADVFGKALQFRLAKDTVLTCQYQSQQTQWKNVSVAVYVDQELNNPYEVKENASESQRLLLDCDLHRDGGDKIEWVHDGAEIRKSDRIKVLDNSSLSFSKTYLIDSGVYFCRSTESKKKRGRLHIFEGKAHIPERNTGSINRLQGDDLEINCDVYGHPMPTVMWKRDGEDLTNASQRVFFGNHNGIPNATLKVVNLDYEDKAMYACIATNKHGTGNTTYLVRVKDKLAALWPFLGIVVEVAILVTIIFIYEKRRSKKEHAEHVEDPVEQKKAFSAENDEKEVRQRKN